MPSSRLEFIMLWLYFQALIQYGIKFVYICACVLLLLCVCCVKCVYPLSPIDSPSKHRPTLSQPFFLGIFFFTLPIFVITKLRLYHQLEFCGHKYCYVCIFGEWLLLLMHLGVCVVHVFRYSKFVRSFAFCWFDAVNSIYCVNDSF